MTIAGVDKLISYNSKKEKKEKAYNGYNFLSLSLNIIIFYISTGCPLFSSRCFQRKENRDVRAFVS